MSVGLIRVVECVGLPRVVERVGLARLVERVGLLVVIALVAFAHAPDASARVIFIPALVRECGEPKTWNGALACLKKHGRVSVVKAGAGAKLVRLVATRRAGGPLVEHAGYLYIERRGRVTLAGTVRDLDDKSRVLAIARVKIGNHTGYRIDMTGSYEVPTPSGRTALARIATSVFCSGEGWRCSVATTACEILDKGKAIETFRGKLALTTSSIKVVGDRSNVADHCDHPEEVFLDWPDE